MTEQQIRRIVREEFEAVTKAVALHIAGCVKRDVERSLPLLLQHAKKRSL